MRGFQKAPNFNHLWRRHSPLQPHLFKCWYFLYSDGVSEKILKDWASLKELLYLIKKGRFDNDISAFFVSKLHNVFLRWVQAIWKSSKWRTRIFRRWKSNAIYVADFLFFTKRQLIVGRFLPARLELTSLLNSCNRFKEVQPSKQIRFWKPRG